MMTKISRVLTFHENKNINDLFLDFYKYIVHELDSMEPNKKGVLYPPSSQHIDYTQQLMHIDNTEEMENNIAYMLPVIFQMILDNYGNDINEIHSLFSAPIFSTGSEVVPFLEFFLQTMKFELNKYIAHPRKQTVANPVYTQFRLVVSVSLFSGNGEEIPK